MKLPLQNKIPETIINGSWKKKAEYFWTYYKFHGIVAAFVLLFLSSMVYHSLTAKEILLNGFFLNSVAQKTGLEELKADFIEEHLIDTSRYDLTFDSGLVYTLEMDSENYSYNYETSQALVTQTAAKELDFVAGDLPVMTVIAYSEYFLDLSEVFRPEQLEMYKSDLLYIDKAVLEKLLESTSVEAEEEMIKIPDCRRPENMEEPIPVMIDISGCEKIMAIYGETEEPIVIGCIINSENVENVVELMKYIY